jgi:hypothetical protein
MSNKHIACVVLSMLISLMAYGTLTMNTKLTAAGKQSEDAATAALNAANMRKGAQGELDKKTRETQGLRDYLEEWQPYLDQTKSETEAERMFTQKLKQGALTIFRQGFEPVSLNKESTIPNALRARLIFEDDYHRILTWLGSLESTLPTCRVSSCRITKGQAGNDIKLELATEVPLAVVTTK